MRRYTTLFITPNYINIARLVDYILYYGKMTYVYHLMRFVKIIVRKLYYLYYFGDYGRVFSVTNLVRFVKFNMPKWWHGPYQKLNSARRRQIHVIHSNTF